MNSFDERVGVDRISKDNYYLGIARSVSMRSTCLRRQYGAVIVKNDRIVSTGYNGAAIGEPNCCEVGECWRELKDIPHGERYEEGFGVHAEANAIIQASAEELEGATLDLYGREDGSSIFGASPCKMCARMIKNAKIAKVISL